MGGLAGSFSHGVHGSYSFYELIQLDNFSDHDYNYTGSRARDDQAPMFLSLAHSPLSQLMPLLTRLLTLLWTVTSDMVRPLLSVLLFFFGLSFRFGLDFSLLTLDRRLIRLYLNKHGHTDT